MSVDIIHPSDAYSDEEMHCPAEWFGGYKAPCLVSAGDADHPLSDAVSGEPVASTFRFTLAEPIPDGGDERIGPLRAQLASPTDRYWVDPISFRLTSRANRALLGTPFTAFVGFITDAQPVFPRQWEITLQDIITRGILQEELNVPWRKIGEGFLDQLDSISDTLDREQAEPILYGRHTRTDPDVEPDPPAAFPIVPVYMGLITVSGTQYHCWMTAGHACFSQTIQVDGVDTPEGSDWLIATQANWLAEFGSPFVDFTSSTYGNDRRYTLILGKFGEATPDACALGDKRLTALVEGIEDAGDGSGALITDFYQQYKHFTVNFLANRGPFSYMSGAWLTAPTWDLIGTGETSIVDEDSFDNASAIALERRPGIGLEGAAAIGVSGGTTSPIQVIANWNRSGFCRFGETQFFRMGITMLHPTQVAKEAAPVFTDGYEVVEGTFGTTVEWPRQATVLRFRADYAHEDGLWKTTDIKFDEDLVTLYNKTTELKRDYPYLPGFTQTAFLAGLEYQSIVHPPRLVRLEQSVGPDDATAVDPDRLAYLNLGDHLRYEHFDAVTQVREERLAQVVFRRIRGNQRTAYVEALDVEDLIDFDAAEAT